MGCRCNERRADLSSAVKNLIAGRVTDAAKNVAHAGRTLAEDARRGDLRRAVQGRLTAIRQGRR